VSFAVILSVDFSAGLSPSFSVVFFAGARENPHPQRRRPQAAGRDNTSKRSNIFARSAWIATASGMNPGSLWRNDNAATRPIFWIHHELLQLVALDEWAKDRSSFGGVKRRGDNTVRIIGELCFFELRAEARNVSSAILNAISTSGSPSALKSGRITPMRLPSSGARPGAARRAGARCRAYERKFHRAGRIPAMAASTRPQSEAVRHIGPILSMVQESAIAP